MHTVQPYMYGMAICTSVATGSGHPDHPGQLGYVLPGSTGSDPIYRIPRSDADFA